MHTLLDWNNWLANEEAKRLTSIPSTSNHCINYPDSLTGTAIVLPSTTATWTSGGVIAGVPSIATSPSVFTWPAAGLTPIEQEELNRLENDRKNRLKEARMNAFKSLPPEVRQKIVDQFIIREACQLVDDVIVHSTPEHLALEAKKGATFYPTNTLRGTYDPLTLRILPKDLTEDDVKNAHTEQLLDEMLSSKE